MMSNKSSFSLASIQQELQLKALIHYNGAHESIDHTGDKEFVNALLKSTMYNLLIFLMFESAWL